MFSYCGDLNLKTFGVSALEMQTLFPIPTCAVASPVWKQMSSNKKIKLTQRVESSQFAGDYLFR